MNADKAVSTIAELSSDSHPEMRIPDPSFAKTTFSFFASAFSVSTPNDGLCR